MIVLMGVAGAGKSTQGRLFADEHGYAWLSMGALLRVLVTGKRRNDMMEGKLLSDEEVIRVLDKTMELIDPSQEFVLDGFPRSLAQADWLMDQAKSGRFELSAVFNLKASKETALRRLADRGRKDDNEAAVKIRFNEYENVTIPVLERFRAAGILVYEIDANKDPITVHDQIVKYINNN